MGFPTHFFSINPHAYFFFILLHVFLASETLAELLPGPSSSLTGSFIPFARVYCLSTGLQATFARDSKLTLYWWYEI